MRNILLLSLILLAGMFAHAWARESSPFFDKPISEKHVPLPHDKFNPDAKAVLNCFYYPNFMTKEVDLGEKGAAQLSIIRNSDDHKAPVCQRKNIKDEIEVTKAWSGYFKGVKGDYVFFDADDGWNGGMGFVIFNGRNGTKIFEDVAVNLHTIDLMPSTALLEPKISYNVPLHLKYTRAYMAPCSLHSDSTNCWNDIKAATGLTDASPPDCSVSYEAEEKRLPEHIKETGGDPSVITYEVDIVVDKDQTVAKVMPVSGVLRCTAAE